MRFQLLGPLSIDDGTGTGTVVLPPSKPTILLATLLLHAGSVVSAESLQRTVWGPDQPATAKAALQTCVLRLRRLFARYGVTETSVDAVPGGYRVTAGPATLDLLAFRERVRDSASLAGDPEAELGALRDALSLWQGPVLANVPSEVLHRDEVPRLTEERLRTLARACDLEMSLGRYGQALVELWSATRAFPAHERFREQLIEALYRSGRQTEALAEYHGIKSHLLEELGVDPSPALQRLELAILRGDDLGPPSAVRPEAAGPPRPHVVRAAEAPPPRAVQPPGQAAVVPVSGVPCFTGRAADTAVMAAGLTAVEDEPVTLLVCGAPGIGKTALARHVAHLARDRFPGGRLLVRMVRPDGTPRTADEAAAGVEAALAAKRLPGPVLLLLDDVVDADQVRPLLPARHGDAVLVTSRRRQAGLVATHGGRVHRLGPFDAFEARQLMVAVLGSTRVDAEPVAARRLAAACGHFPLALRITTAWLSTRPGLRLADAAEWLAEDLFGRLSLADDPRLSVARVLGAALDRVENASADAFRRLGALSPADADGFRAQDVTALLDGPVSPSEAMALLDRLADAGLLEDGPPGPYRMHALVRAYARQAARVPPHSGGALGTPDGPPSVHRPPQKV